MTLILAIDPGPEESAWVLYGTTNGQMHAWAKVQNDKLCHSLRYVGMFGDADLTPDLVVIEMIASYGMPVGIDVFETCVWIGRFIEAWGLGLTRITRTDVKRHLCHRVAKVTDAVIRQALIDRFGPGKDRAIGRKATPGPLYGLSGDGWAALAVAVTAADTLPAISSPSTTQSRTGATG